MTETSIQPDPTGFETLEAFSEAPAFNRWLYEKTCVDVQGRILEIGSGIGNISAFLLEDHSDVYLSDLRPEYCQLLEKKFAGHPALKGVFELDLSLNNFQEKYSERIGKFDVVIASNVIEHIADDKLAIQNAGSLLTENGKLIILVPACPALYNSLDKELGHFRRYTRAGLNHLLKSTGMQISESKYFNAAAILGWWFSGKVLKEKTISPVKLNIYNRLIPVFRIIDWFMAPLTGVSVISVGIKKPVRK